MIVPFSTGSNKAYVRLVLITCSCLSVMLISKIVQAVYTTQASRTLIARELLQQALKWYDLSKQDTNMMYRLQHLNYAKAYLSATRHVCRESVIESASGIDLQYLRKIIAQEQTIATKKIQKNHGNSGVANNGVANNGIANNGIVKSGMPNNGVANHV